ncbi:MAG: arylesterase [Arcobacteraceae bacterium]
MKKIILFVFILTLQIISANNSDNKKSTIDSILFLGDSLTEGLGVSRTDAFPYLVEKLIQKELQKDIKVINGGVSGSTTADGLDRLKWYLKRKPSIVFITLGANDGLRGLDLTQSQKNLEVLIEYAQNADAKVMLASMLIPPNYGPKYAEQFKTMYENLQTKYNLKNTPFLLENVAGKKELNQRDGIHPNEQGHKIIAQNIFTFLKEQL